MSDLTLERVNGRLERHEAVCAERQGTIISRLNRIETLALTATGTLIAGMGGIIWTLWHT